LLQLVSADAFRVRDGNDYYCLRRLLITHLALGTQSKAALRNTLLQLLMLPLWHHHYQIDKLNLPIATKDRTHTLVALVKPTIYVKTHRDFAQPVFSMFR